jgi:hypothetical protein
MVPGAFILAVSQRNERFESESKQIETIDVVKGRALHCGDFSYCFRCQGGHTNGDSEIRPLSGRSNGCEHVLAHDLDICANMVKQYIYCYYAFVLLLYGCDMLMTMRPYIYKAGGPRHAVFDSLMPSGRPSN